MARLCPWEDLTSTTRGKALLSGPQPATGERSGLCRGRPPGRGWQRMEPQAGKEVGLRLA